MSEENRTNAPEEELTQEDINSLKKIRMDKLEELKAKVGIKKTIQWYLDNREWWQTIISGEYQNYYEKMYGNR